MGKATATIVGQLGKDPEVRSTASGKKIVAFSIPVEQGFGDKKETKWFTVIAWEKLAEFSEKYLKKGSGVVVLGLINVSSWDDKTTGQKRERWEINAKDISFLDSGSSGGSSRSTTTTPTRREAAPADRRAAETDPFVDEDIPF